MEADGCEADPLSSAMGGSSGGSSSASGDSGTDEEGRGGYGASAAAEDGLLPDVGFRLFR